MKAIKAKNRSSFFKENKFIFVSGLCALAIMVLVYFCYDLIPFGDMTILRMDLYHQYGRCLPSCMTVSLRAGHFCILGNRDSAAVFWVIS